jgi:hypothetical protein
MAMIISNSGPPKDSHILTSRICKCYLIQKKGPLQSVFKDFEMRRLSWILWVGPQCITSPRKHRERPESPRGGVKIQAETEVL